MDIGGRKQDIGEVFKDNKNEDKKELVSIKDNMDINMFFNNQNKPKEDRKETIIEIDEEVLEVNFVIQSKKKHEPTKEEILDQEISPDLKKANELISDSEVFSKQSKQKSELTITDQKIIENLPKHRPNKVYETVADRIEDISKLLENLNSKHTRLINHFSPQKDGKDLPDSFSNRVSKSVNLLIVRRAKS